MICLETQCATFHVIPDNIDSNFQAFSTWQKHIICYIFPYMHLFSRLFLLRVKWNLNTKVEIGNKHFFFGTSVFKSFKHTLSIIYIPAWYFNWSLYRCIYFLYSFNTLDCYKLLQSRQRVCSLIFLWKIYQVLWFCL